MTEFFDRQAAQAFASAFGQNIGGSDGDSLAAIGIPNSAELTGDVSVNRLIRYF